MGAIKNYYLVGIVEYLEIYYLNLNSIFYSNNIAIVCQKRCALLWLEISNEPPEMSIMLQH